MADQDRKEYMKAYARENWDRIKGHKKAYRDRNPEKQQEYRLANKSKLQAQEKSRYEANRQARLERNRAYYEANKDRIHAQQKAYRDVNKKNITLRRQSSLYGISRKTLLEMAESQNDCCAICKTSLNLVMVNVDHCHKTGAVRGLLCGECNRGLACFRDKPELMRAAIRYLAKYCGSR